jgi:hypothetical protein
MRRRRVIEVMTMPSSRAPAARSRLGRVEDEPVTGSDPAPGNTVAVGKVDVVGTGAKAATIGASGVVGATMSRRQWSDPQSSWGFGGRRSSGRGRRGCCGEETSDDQERARSDSNTQPSDPKPNAPSMELRARMWAGGVNGWATRELWSSSAAPMAPIRRSGCTAPALQTHSLADRRAAPRW